jgi:sulfhydrogenase subunit gamma (sulfur reductase)
MTHDCHWRTLENIFMPREATIVRTTRPTPHETHLTLRMTDGQPLAFQPGQMLEVSLFGYGEIPIGLASSPTRERTFDLVVRTVGRVSTALSALGRGQSVYIRGPLGRGFDLDRLRGRDVLIIAGGIGLCPTRSLIQYILDRRQEFGRFVLFYGARDPKQMLFAEDLRAWRVSREIEYHETVDRAGPGWKGHVGVITTLFKQTRIDPAMRVVICGPPVMFRFVMAELDRLGVAREHVFVDLERRMKCGVGKCGHCQINDRYVCVDGPVFSYAEIQDLEEAI